MGAGAVTAGSSGTHLEEKVVLGVHDEGLRVGMGVNDALDIGVRQR